MSKQTWVDPNTGTRYVVDVPDDLYGAPIRPIQHANPFGISDQQLHKIFQDIWQGSGMAWNFEKGCEEPNPYPRPAPAQAPPPRPSPQRPDTRVLRHRWDMAENTVISTANIWVCGANLNAATKYAKLCWYSLEIAMLWDDQANIPAFRQQYIEWLESGRPNKQAGPPSEPDISTLPMLERIIAKGYRELAKKAHPDAGGTREQFEELGKANTQLQLLLKTLKDLL